LCGFAQQSRSFHVLQDCSALVRDGRLAAVLELLAGHLRSLRFDYLSEQEWRVDAVCRCGDGWRAALFSDAEQFCGELFQGTGRSRPGWSDELHHAAGWLWSECALAISGDGDASAELVFRLHRIYDSVRVCAGGAAGAVSR